MVCNSKWCASEAYYIDLEDLHETRSEVASSFLEMGSHDRRANGRGDETDADDEDEAEDERGENNESDDEDEAEDERGENDENDDEDERGENSENEADDENEDEAEDDSEDENDTRARQKPKKKGFFGRMFDAGKSLLKSGKALVSKGLRGISKGVKSAWKYMKKVYVAVVNSLNPLKKLASKIFLKNKNQQRLLFHCTRVGQSICRQRFEIRIKGNLKIHKDASRILLFEVVSNNGEEVELGKPFMRTSVTFSRRQGIQSVVVPRHRFQKHLKNAMSIRVTLRAASTDGRLVDFDQETIQLHIRKLHISNLRRSDKMMVFDVTSQTLCASQNLEFINDEPYGDRTHIGQLGNGAVKKSIKIPLLKKAAKR